MDKLKSAWIMAAVVVLAFVLNGQGAFADSGTIMIVTNLTAEELALDDTETDVRFTNSWDYNSTPDPVCGRNLPYVQRVIFHNPGDPYGNGSAEVFTNSTGAVGQVLTVYGVTECGDGYRLIDLQVSEDRIP